MTVPQSYFQNVPSPFKISAIRNSDVLVFAKTDLLQIVESSVAIKEFYHNQIVNALLSEIDFRTKLLTYSPKKMYELLITDYQDVIQNVSSRHITNFIGISPEWLSNLKKIL